MKNDKNGKTRKVVITATGLVMALDTVFNDAKILKSIIGKNKKNRSR